VELLDNPSRDHQMEKTESPSVELPGKLHKIKGFEGKAYRKSVVEEY
jgi:hypothetical protein